MNNWKANRWMDARMGLLLLLLGFALNVSASSDQQGPHGGKLLRDGDITLELLIFETNVEPEFRAWIQRDGQAVDTAKLAVILTRLGGESDRFEFRYGEDYWRAEGLVSEPHSFDVKATLTLNGKTYDWTWASYEGRVEISSEMAKKTGITTSQAGSGRIERHVQVYGRLDVPPSQRVEVRGRFPGLVNAVEVNVGDVVKAGDTLAIIESNDSLKPYKVRAPISGVVQSRSVNVGEVTNSQSLFTLINTQNLWALLKVFPGQRAEVKPGLSVHIVHAKHEHDAFIDSVTPAAQGEPFVLARVELGNPSGDMAPGDLVSGEIDAEVVAVPLVIDNRALQSIRNWDVVFVQVGNFYEARPITLGRNDGRHTEVLGGLKPGDHYVVENSYLIKADIEKSGASHAH